MSIRTISLGAMAALAATPALATAAVAPATAPATAKPVPPVAAPVTRAGLIKNRDDAFKKIDTNGDGSLSAAELAANDASVLNGRLQAEFAKLDTNKDGSLSRAEFMAAGPQPAALTTAAQRTVAALDKNKDGKVTADEFRAPQLAGFDAIDTNHDGVLSDAEKKAAAAKKK